MKHTKFFSLFLTFTLSLSLFGCGSKIPTDLTSEIATKNITGKVSDTDFVTSQLEFSVELFKHVSNKSDNENILISPLSAQLALSMTANGADGATKTEMENVLGGNILIEELNDYLYHYTTNLPSNKDEKLEIANSIWLKDADNSLSVNEDFLDTAANYYKAQIYKENFNKKTLNKINTWVDESTDGMIDKIIDEIDQDTIMYLINALVFDAKWQEPYKSKNISNGEFTSVSGDKRTVKMMKSTESQFLEDNNAVGFIKDYVNGDYKFVALLPKEGIDISDYIDTLTHEYLIDILDNVREDSVTAIMPKFSYDYSLSMNEILMTMGMPTAFDGSNADFSKMAQYTNGNIFIGDVLQKTYISVDGLGTKAGAVTKVEITKNAMAPAMNTVTLNRPFVYMIVDGKNNLPIFMGAVMDIK